MKGSKIMKSNYAVFAQIYFGFNDSSLLYKQLCNSLIYSCKEFAHLNPRPLLLKEKG